MYASRIKIGSELVLASTVPRFFLDGVLKRHPVSALGWPMHSNVLPGLSFGHLALPRAFCLLLSKSCFSKYSFVLVSEGIVVVMAIIVHSILVSQD